MRAKRVLVLRRHHPRYLPSFHNWIHTVTFNSHANMHAQKAPPSEPKKRKSTDTNSDDSPPLKSQKTKTAGASKTQPKKKDTDKHDFDVSDIYLSDEDPDDVEIYDTPAELRRKINAHLKQPGVTKAGLCRQMGVTPRSLETFLKKKGRREGNDSKVFPASYIFFEKLRIKQGKKKSKVRQEMEEVWGFEGGMDRYAGAFIIPRADGLSVDKYGKLEIVRGYTG
jgi:hypothetical protein